MRISYMSVSKNVWFALLASALPLAGCGDYVEEDDLSPGVTILDKRIEALTSSEIASINGSYSAECLGRASGNWSLAVTGSPTLDNTALSVVRGDSDCVLTLTGIRTSTALYAASSNIALGTSYAGSASSFGSPIQFYANAKLSLADFSSDYTLTLLFSDNASTATASNTASFVVATATAAAQGVTAPDYSMSLSGVTVQTNISNVVQSVSGNLALTVGAADATNYVIVGNSITTTYAGINTAYLAGTPVAMSTSMAASSFLATSTDLTTAAVRTLILAKVTNGVRSYQVFTITFNKPTT
jgi:hypothetical protein